MKLNIFSIILGLSCSMAAWSQQVFPDLRINLLEAKGFSNAQLQKLDQALAVMTWVGNSEEFKESVINFTYLGKHEYVQNKGLTNEQIYRVFREGAETTTPAIDYEADIHLTLYTPPWWKKRTVVGYTNPGNPMQFINSYYFSDFTPAQIAGNLTHEWLHRLGFEHDFNRTERRPYSVPYALGAMVIDVANKSYPTTR